MTVAALVLSTTVGLLGLVVALGRFHRADSDHRLSITPSPGSVERGSVAVVTCVVVVVVSGWLVPGLVLGAGAGWAFGAWRFRQRGDRGEIAHIDALASWIESVRDVLIAGEQPVGAITTTVAGCPSLIRPAVRRLAAGLGRHDTDVVFRRFADDIDDPIGDLVAIGLLIAVRRGARTAGVLSALAEQARQHADRRRLVEAERAPTRREVAGLTVVMACLVGALFVFGRSEYLRAYDDAAGQVFLAVAIAAFAALLIRVQRLARFPRPARFLSLAGRPA
jgi:tight adherence protein B